MGLICYGAGEHGHWGVHTHQKAFSAFAILAALKEIDLSDFVCTDGEKWGHNWIYALGIERMFHAVEASEKPQGLLVPKDDSSLAEWRFNLTARILGVGRKNFDTVETKKVETFDGGFLTSGTTISCSDDFMAEGQLREKIARKHIAFAALPDESTVLCLQYAKALNRSFLSEVSGIYWNVPNDIFNNRQRYCLRLLDYRVKKI